MKVEFVEARPEGDAHNACEINRIRRARIRTIVWRQVWPRLLY